MYIKNSHRISDSFAVNHFTLLLKIKVTKCTRQHDIFNEREENVISKTHRTGFVESTKHRFVSDPIKERNPMHYGWFCDYADGRGQFSNDNCPRSIKLLLHSYCRLIEASLRMRMIKRWQSATFTSGPFTEPTINTAVIAEMKTVAAMELFYSFKTLFYSYLLRGARFMTLCTSNIRQAMA